MIQNLLQQLKAQPNNPDLYHQLGVYYYRVGVLEQAQQAFKQALVLRPNFVEVLHDLADTYFHAVQHSLALELYLRAMQLQSPSIIHLIKTAICYREVGQYKKALIYFEQALQLTLSKDIENKVEGPEAIFINTLPKSGSVYIIKQVLKHTTKLK